MSLTVAVPTHAKLGEGFSKRQKIKALEHPGRRTTPHGYQSAVSWVAELLARRKVLILCMNCCRAFEQHVMRREAYRRVFIPDYTGQTDGYTVNGACDVCKQETALVGGGRAYQPEEFYRLNHLDPSEARQASRAAAKQLGTWAFVQREQRRRR